MANRYLKEYIESKNNKQYNYDQILLKVEGVSKMNSVRIKFRRAITVLAAIVIIAVVTPQVYAKIQWNIEFQEYQNRDYESGFGVLNDSNFSEEVDMDYIYQNGIKVKVDSLLITDDKFKTNINFEFDENINVPSREFAFSYAVYDENNNIYEIFSRTHKDQKRDKITPYIYEELGIKYDKKNAYANQLSTSSSFGNIEAHDRNIISEIEIRTIKEFPKSKKIFIRIFDLGYTMYDISYDEANRPKLNSAETFTISDCEWIFEIDVPEKFYERTTTNLKLKEEIPGVKISKLAITESGLVVEGIFEGSNDIISAGKDMESNKWSDVLKNLLYITDGEDNYYIQISLGTDTEKDSINATFNVNKDILEKSGLWLNYTDSNGELHKTELVKE